MAGLLFVSQAVLEAWSDVAYEVQPGFLAAASAVPGSALEQRDPAQLLACFRSENLS